MEPANDHSYRELRTLAACCSLGLLLLHYYYFCHRGFAAWNLTHPIADRFVSSFAAKGLFRHPTFSLFMALLALSATVPGSKTIGPLKVRRLLTLLIPGAALYFGATLILHFNADPARLTIAYLVATLTGLSLLYISVKGLAGLITWPSKRAVFNQYNESFPQEERRLSHPNFLHLKGRYRFRNQWRECHINLDAYRNTIIAGSPGSGKTRYIFRQLIRQSIERGMTVFVYDLKYDGLTRFVYNALEQARPRLSHPPEFHSFNFNNLNTRCNVLDPGSLEDLSDASECARTLLYGINRRAAHQQGEFFTESAVNFFTANIWFLRQYEDGRYCTLPHLIELMSTDYARLFSVLRSYPDIAVLVHPFTEAFTYNVMEQLQGQLDSARIPLFSLVSPKLYYLLSVSDFSLDINNPASPRILCLGSDPGKQHIYGAVISLLVSRLLKVVNHKGRVPCHIYIDEFTSFHALGMDTTLATCREHKVGVFLGIQSLDQVRKEYGRDHADALFNLPANLICSQVSGDTTRFVSERFGKILQEKSTVSNNRRDSSTSHTQQLDLALPASKIATLSSGEFVGITADSPDQPMPLKAFHCQILLQQQTPETEEIPSGSVPREVVERTFQQIQNDVKRLVEKRLDHMRNSPALSRLIIHPKLGARRKKKGPE